MKSHEEDDWVLVEKEITPIIIEPNPQITESKAKSLKKILSKKSLNGNEPKTKFKWERVKLLGRGGNAKVYLGRNQDGTRMAVKQVALMHQFSSKAEAELKALENEVEMMKGLDHPNIIKYLGTERTDRCLFIFMEYISGGNLCSVIRKFKKRCLPESVVQNYVKQILQGLNYLHKKKIIHRDIKGENILVDKGVVKLADFGSSKLIINSQQHNSFKGTPAWMSPEVIRYQQYSYASDIWSLGCTIIEMITGKKPWEEEIYGLAPEQIILKIGNKSIDPLKAIPDNISENLKDFLRKCFADSPNDRPTAEELLQHPFLVQEVKNDDEELNERIDEEDEEDDEEEEEDDIEEKEDNITSYATYSSTCSEEQFDELTETDILPPKKESIHDITTDLPRRYSTGEINIPTMRRSNINKTATPSPNKEKPQSPIARIRRISVKLNFFQSMRCENDFEDECPTRSTMVEYKRRQTQII